MDTDNITNIKIALRTCGKCGTERETWKEFCTNISCSLHRKNYKPSKKYIGSVKNETRKSKVK